MYVHTNGLSHVMSEKGVWGGGGGIGSRWCFLKGIESLFLLIYPCTFFHLRGTKFYFWGLFYCFWGVKFRLKMGGKRRIWWGQTKQCVLRVENSQIFFPKYPSTPPLFRYLMERPNSYEVQIENLESII